MLSDYFAQSEAKIELMQKAAPRGAKYSVYLQTQRVVSGQKFHSSSKAALTTSGNYRSNKLTSHANFGRTTDERLAQPKMILNTVNSGDEQSMQNSQDVRLEQVMSNQTVRLNELKYNNRVASTSNVHCMKVRAVDSTLTKNNSLSPDRPGISMIKSH